MTTSEEHAPLRVIQVGIGGFGSSWAELARGCDGIELVAVVDHAPAAQQWAVKRLGLTVGEIFANLDTALSTIPCDAVLVITPPATHHAVATKALRAGKHVLIEKPLATTIPEARGLIATADSQERLLVVSQNYRFRHPARAIREFVGSGEMGELLSVEVAFRRDSRTLWPADNFRYKMRHPTVLDMAIHHIDLIRALTRRNITRVDARSWRVPDSPYQHDPAVAAVFDLDGGVPAVYHGDWATHGDETSWNGAWALTGERGRLVWTGELDDPLLGIAKFSPWHGDPRELPRGDLPAEDRTGSLLAFRHAVLSGEPADTHARDNIWSLAAVGACVASIERREPVSVSELIERPS